MKNSYQTQTTLLNGSFREYLATGKAPKLSPLLFSILFVFLGVRLLFAYLLGPGFDEAYYYSYTLRPALSYFDHPPLVAFFAGLFPEITGMQDIFYCRLSFVILFTFSGYFFAKLCRMFLNERETIYALILFNATPIFLVCAGLMVLPDGPMSFFWVTSLYFYWKILHLPYKKTNWCIAGVLSGLTMLGKYHGVLLVGFLVLYIIFHRRDLLRVAGPYLFALFAIFAFSPVLIWNYQNEFVSFIFQGKRALGTEISTSDFFTALGGQAAYLTPFLFFQMYFVMFKCCKDMVWLKDIRARFFVYFGVAPVVFFLAISMVRDILPHWPLAGYIVLTIPLGYLVANQCQRSLIWKRFYMSIFVIVFSLYFIILAQAKYGVLHLEKLVEVGLLQEKDLASGDATLDTYGWEKIGKYLDQGNFNQEDIFLFTGKWYISGEVELATKGKWNVYCFNQHGAIGYGIWAKDKDLVGKDGIFITTDRHFTDPLPKYASYFESISHPQYLQVRRGGVVVKSIMIYRCKNLLRNFEYN